MPVNVLKYRQMTIIKSSGPPIREFGREHRRQLDTGNVQETFSTLRNALPGFKEAITRLQRLGTRFAIHRNRRNIGGDEFPIYGTREMWIVPVITGNKRAGPVQTITGIAMVVVATIATGGIGGFATGGAQGSVGATGAFLALGGIVQMLSPQAQSPKQGMASENLPSYAFGSARNITASGNPAPICYEECRQGGAIISTSIYAEDKI